MNKHLCPVACLSDGYDWDSGDLSTLGHSHHMWRKVIVEIGSRQLWMVLTGDMPYTT